MSSLRLRAYRKLNAVWIRKRVAAKAFSEERRREERERGIFAVTLPEQLLDGRAWFHAASAGELESLWPVIAEWCRAGGEAIVTIFSESARKPLARLEEELRGSGRLVFAGYSPWEGQWREAFARAKPAVFVTAKYEAWPELWASAAELRVPVLVVGASSRPSLKVAKKVCLALGARLPNLIFLAPTENGRAALSREFPGARVERVGDPRWDRMKARAAGKNGRAQALLQSSQRLARPWGILAQVWPEDIAIWSESLPPGKLEGTLWVVPHQVDAESVSIIESALRGLGRDPMRTSGVSGAIGGTDCLLVDEMGFLAELYAGADWAYVGGGFGRGVHSTIEPAIQGIPVACGPSRAHRFPEIAELEQDRQLTMLRGPEDVARWVAGAGEMRRSMGPEWKDKLASRFGATEEVMRILSELTRG